jgi:hypothetical protein
MFDRKELLDIRIRMSRTRPKSPTLGGGDGAIEAGVQDN